jgi:penicillin-binding protein 2
MRVGWSSGGADRRDKARLLAFAGCFFLFLLTLRLLYLQVFHADEYKTLAQGNFLRPEVIPAMRGVIRDRNGVLLASSIPSFTASIDPHHEAFRSSAALRSGRTLDHTIRAFAALTGDNPTALLEAVQKQAGTSYQPARLRRNLDLAMVSVIAEHRHDLPGVVLEMEPLRNYPYGMAGAHVLGYLSEVNDNELSRLRGKGYFPGASIGRSGVERYYEDILKGEDGFRFIEVNALGRRSNYFGSLPPVLPRMGKDLTLTLDWKLQMAAEAAMDSAGWSGGQPVPEVKGAAIAIDPRTGEILALVSRPAFDPNGFAGGLSPAQWADLNTEGRHALMNRAVQSRYPPGSTFKPVTLIAGLMGGKVRPSTTLHGCAGGYNYGSRFFRCWKSEGHGISDAVRAIQVSCDVYFYQVGAMLGVDGIAAMARKMRVAELTGIDLPQEKKGSIPDAAWYDKQFGSGNWSRGAALNLSIGQGEILLTPIELASFVSALATGKIPRPHVLKESSTADGENHAAPVFPPRGPLDVDPSALDVVRHGMYEVVMGAEGTAKKARIDSVDVAGKTGSAQHSGDPTHALFIGYAPYSHPEIAVAVVLEARGGGGAFAAPVAHAIMDHYFHPEHYLPRPDSTAAALDSVSAAVVVDEPESALPLPEIQ